MNSTHSLFRPPAEARSLVIRIQDGCPWNQCAFCGMYKGVNGRGRSLEEIERALDAARADHPSARRIFLADGDVMAYSFDQLLATLGMLNDRFPRLARVNIYANGGSILRKTDAELAALRRLRLNTLYMGLESGHEATLRAMKKRETAAEMVEAGVRAQAAGLKVSVMILTGLGGKEHRKSHAAATASALNRMQPRLLSALRVIPIPGTELFDRERAGAFEQVSEHEAIEELKWMIEPLDLDGTVFRADHASNVLPLEGRFPKDQPRLIRELETLLASGALDPTSPGPPPLSL